MRSLYIRNTSESISDTNKELDIAIQDMEETVNANLNQGYKKPYVMKTDQLNRTDLAYK